MIIISLMSGSSLDGVDIGLIEITPEPSYRIIRAATVPYSKVWKQKLISIRGLSISSYFELEAEYSHYLSDCIAGFLKGESIVADCISVHGHSVIHQVSQGFSVQLGNAGIMAARAGIPAISDYRTVDMAKGGQGAPLMALLDQDFFSQYGASVNLGGICNISSSYIGKSIAYDMGPCNQLLNAAANARSMEMDIDSELARAGKLNTELLQYFTDDPFLKLAPPKSLDNWQLQKYYLDNQILVGYSPEDFARTACVFISKLISEELLLLEENGLINPNSREILFTGGGVHHAMLWSYIESACIDINFQAIKPEIELIDFKELILMAYLGYCRINNKHNILSDYTGASSDSIAGAIYEP